MDGMDWMMAVARKYRLASLVNCITSVAGRKSTGWYFVVEMRLVGVGYEANGTTCRGTSSFRQQLLSINNK
jgi:hypothetical protein